MSPRSPDAEAALAVCVKLLRSLTTAGQVGKAEFVSTLAPGGQASHARPPPNASIPPPVISHEKNLEEFPNRIPWDTKVKMEEGIDDGKGGREVVVLVDHDIAMVWTPYWFKNDGVLSHVGTNCFTLIKHPVGTEAGDGEWKVVGMTDTARYPDKEDRDRLE